MKKLISLVLALAMVLLCVGAAVADETSSHTITITNTDQNVTHSYEAYQIFVGKLNDTQTKLSDIVWGSGIEGANFLTALKANTTIGADFTNCATAADVAEVLGTYSSTSGASEASGKIDVVADIISQNLKTKAADFTANGTTYTATVTGDGYYFIKDVTTNLEGTTGSDTKSKHLLSVIKNTTIVAKDTHLTPDKKIVDGQQEVEADSAAVGDTVTFKVKIPVPNTKKYVNKFLFDMVDTLPIGLTFTGITSVKVGDDNVPYTLTVDNAAYSAPTDPVDADAPSAGQVIKLVFTEFKANAEAADPTWIGQDLIVTYTAVVNKKADFTPSGNKNKVKFDYSNDPNHNYTGNEPNPPMGETPEDETTTLLINIDIQKTGDQGSVAALAGAEFEITSDDYNVTLVTGEKFVASDYTLASGETEVSSGWYKLKDGSYTQTVPTEDNATAYESTEVTYKKVAYSDSVITPGATKKVTVISNENGKINLKGLRPGTYTIKETKAPTGYNLDPNTYTIKVDWNGSAFVLDDAASSTGVTFSSSSAVASLTIDNNSGTTLPSTGGIGTTIFYILGGLLVVGAAVILVARRKAHE